MPLPADLSPDDVAFAGVVGQRALLRDGRLTATDLLELSLARTARLDDRLGAFRKVLHASARAEAAAADEALARGDDRPLLGVPVAVKDNVPVAGEVATLGTGSPEPVAAEDGLVAARLRAAGAVVVGITTMPELALWPFTESRSTGVTRNPWQTGHTPGGSSGGSAAAVAAGLVAAAHASDGGGSIRVPAACCHLVGLKAGRGVVPTPDHWEGLSSHGVVTRTAADSALLLAVLTGRPMTSEPLTEPTGLRIAWSTRGAVPTPVAPAVRGALEGTLEVLRGLGHAVEQGDPDLSGVQVAFLARYAAGARQDYLALADRSGLEARTHAAGKLGARLPAGALARAHGASARIAARLATLPGGADVLVTPTLPAPPQRTGAHRGLATLATAGRVVPFTVPWNVTGQPAVSVPAGLTADGLPLAVQLVGRPGDEALLLSLAAQLERATGFASRRPPLS